MPAQGNPYSVSTGTGHSASDGLGQKLGLDEIGLDNHAAGITATQATTTITASGDVLPYLPKHTLTGTIATSGTAVTGTGTQFFNELAIGDLLGTDAEGYSRVTAIASDTSATLTAALPDGDATAGSTAKRIENMAVEIAANGPEAITSIDSAGTSIVVGNSRTEASAVALNFGGLKTGWLWLWTIDDPGTESSVMISSQRTQLIAPPSGFTASARITAIYYDGSELTPVRSYGDGEEKTTQVEVDVNDARSRVYTAVAPATSATWTTIDLSAFVPPTCTWADIWVNIENDQGSGSSNFPSRRSAGTGII